PDLLDNGRAGILVYSQSADEYCSKIYSFLNEKDARDNVTMTALNRVETIYSAENNASEYYLAYRHIKQ
ncbi:MAG: hypothetical protein KJO47_01250, partial [Gammaproteobacteria bacterium]|nr:hypothetical protein [Gammaproteobacteria bacterium]